MKKQIKSKDAWFVIERIPDINYVMLYTIFVDYGKRLKEQGAGDFLRQIMWIIKNGVADLCYVRSEFDRTIKRIASKAVKNPIWLSKINKEVELFADQYLAFAKSLLKIDLKRLSDRQLINKFNRILYFQLRSHGYGQATTWLIDAGQQLFSGYLLDYLKMKVKENLDFEPSQYFSMLTTPLKPSFTEMESQASLQLAKEIFQDKVGRQIFKNFKINKIETELEAKRPGLLIKLKKHQKKWFWLHYNYRGPVLGLDYFLQIWQGLIKEEKIEKHLQEARNKFNKVKKEQQRLSKELKLDALHKELFLQARYIVWLKAYRKDCMYFGAFVANQFIREIAKRLSISFQQAEFMTKEEYGEALIKKKFSVKELDERFKFSVIYGTWDKVYVYSREKAKRFLKRLKWEREEKREVDELVGQTACPGKVKGKVKIVETVAEISKMKQGDIMLSETTYPALVPAMKKAGAIVTNVGGLTCHAAIVARELRIPCVVGTRIATQVFKDGDEVEVDADKGIIRKL